MTLPDRLAAIAAGPQGAAWQPRIFDLMADSDRLQLSDLLDSGTITGVRDNFTEQLNDWLKASEPGRTWTASSLREATTALLGNRSVVEYGVWVFFPWTGILTHLLPEANFHFLRTARNRHKISAAEQRLLGEKTIAIVGLSVGVSIATTLALEGIGRRFRLADFDVLGISNLNRLRASVCDLGVNKAVLAARQLYEIDPFLHIELFSDGVTAGSIEAFLSPPLDLLIEECDDLAIKIGLREAARRRRIPVLMDTSDRGLLDVERFDLEPDRPLLHGLTENVRAEDLAGLSPADKVPIVLQILDCQRLSVEMRASLPEIGKTIETWPQLASSVALGGGITADAARRILLGQFTTSGRYYVDTAELVCDGAGIEIQPVAPRAVAAFHVPSLPPTPPPGTGSLSADELRFLIEHAVLAPSGGNSQPWRFEWQSGELFGYIVPERTQPLIDFEYRGCFLALGAALENISLAAAELGLTAEIQPPGEVVNLAFRAQFTRTIEARPEPALYSQISLRVTNRKPGNRTKLSASAKHQLTAAAAARGATLELLEETSDLKGMAQLMGRCDRNLLLTRTGHAETFQELRFDPADVRRTRDGLDVDSLEVSPSGRIALEMLSAWPVMKRVREVGGGAALEEMAIRAVASSAAIGLVRIPGNNALSFVSAGRAIQRLWLTATSLGLAIHPWTALPFFVARVEQGNRGSLSGEELTWFTELVAGYRDLFPADTGVSDAFLFRLGQADPPTARSLRRDVDDVFRWIG